MGVDRRVLKRTAQTLRPVTIALRNEQFGHSLQRQHSTQTARRPTNSRKNQGKIDPCVTGPNYQLQIYEDLIKVEYQLKKWKPLNKTDLRRKATKMRDEHVLGEQKKIGEQVHQNAMRNMQRAADEEMQTWDDGNGIDVDDEDTWLTEEVWSSTGIEKSGEDTVELVKRLHPNSFIEIPSGYRKQRQRLWQQMSEEEEELSIALLEYDLASRIDVSEWDAGDNMVTLIGWKLDHVKIRVDRRCSMHGKTDEHAIRQDLIARGFIPATMGKRFVAFDVEMLKLYMKLFAYGQVSRQAWVRTLCDFLSVEYTDYARTLFGDALELFTRLGHLIQLKSERCLGNSSTRSSKSGGIGEEEEEPEAVIPPETVVPETMPKTASEYAVQPLKQDVEAERCPSCFYELTNEPEREYSKMFTVDGNFSWKRLVRAHEDHGRCYGDSTFRIPGSVVDMYDEKHHSSRPRCFSKWHRTSTRKMLGNAPGTQEDLRETQ